MRSAASRRLAPLRSLSPVFGGPEAGSTMQADTRARIERELGSELENVRWQAAILAGEHVKGSPEAVWSIVEQWGCVDDEDTRTAVATCILEHLLEYHFDLIFPRVAELANRNSRFAETFRLCSKFGQSELPDNAKRFAGLLRLTRRKSRRCRRTRG